MFALIKINPAANSASLQLISGGVIDGVYWTSRSQCCWSSLLPTQHVGSWNTLFTCSRLLSSLYSLYAVGDSLVSEIIITVIQQLLYSFSYTSLLRQFAAMICQDFQLLQFSQSFGGLKIFEMENFAQSSFLCSWKKYLLHTLVCLH